jgi:hypothetical protein
VKASRPCPLCGLAMPGQRCGWCHGSGIVTIEFLTPWDGLKWHLYRTVPLLRGRLGPVRINS